MACNRCTDTKCLGTILLHEKELIDIDERKVRLKVVYGDVTFNLTVSPSSGEIFTKFYDLHVLTKELRK